MIRDQALVEMLGREIPVARVEQRQNLHHRVHRHPAARHLAETPVVKPFRTLGFVAVTPAPKRPVPDTPRIDAASPWLNDRLLVRW